MNKELTKEEILANWGIFDSNESFNNANEAMQQYADQEKKKEAVGFAEWIEKKNWFQDGDFMWFHDVNDINRKSTEQLYELFNQQK